MACSYVFTPRARKQIRDIVWFLKHDVENESSARAFVAEFRRQVGLVCTYPYMRAVSSDPKLAAEEYRTFPVGRYLALYRVEGDEIVITRVFHQAQDYARIAVGYHRTMHDDESSEG